MGNKTARDVRAGTSVDWRRFLASGSPREVLARLVDGDPLGVRVTVAERLYQSRQLLDAERVWLRALARIARFSCRYRGRPEFSVWRDERCDEAIADILEEERAAVQGGEPSAEATGEVFKLLAEPLGIGAQEARRACVALHDCSLEERTAFFALVLEARSLDVVASELDCDPTLVARRARRVLLALLHPNDRTLEVLP